MIGLILIFSIGKHFYKLAQEFEKSPPFGYAVLGVIVYYGGMILFSLSLGVVIALVKPNYIDNLNNLVIGLIAIPFGILSCWLLSKYQRKRWSKTSVNSTFRQDILDQDLQD